MLRLVVSLDTAATKGATICRLERRGYSLPVLDCDVVMLRLLLVVSRGIHTVVGPRELPVYSQELTALEGVPH